MRYYVTKLILLVASVHFFSGCLRPQKITAKRSALVADDAGSADGLAKLHLYDVHCSKCHGTVDVSTKRGASFTAVKQAIARVPEMSHLASLSDKDITDIAEALSNDKLICRDASKPGPIVVQRLSRREHANTLVDLLGLNYDPLPELPEDARGKSFTNISSLQIISDISFEISLKATEKAVAAFWREAGSAKSKYLSCDVESKDAFKVCVPSFLERFAYYAFRRPVASSELLPYIELIKARQIAGDDMPSSVQSALVAMLISPSFVYRSEVDSSLELGADLYELNSFELASRLSYFLWGSMPDDELLEAAKKQTLEDTLVQQMKRMLAHKKSDYLINTFASEWMHLYRLRDKQPSNAMYKDFDPALLGLMEKENNEFFSYFKRENQNLLDMIDAPFTFVNAKLAAFYKLPGVTGDSFIKTDLPSSLGRSGLLSQGAILAVTSGNTTTSPVLRGNWVINQILCTTLPNPPDDVGPLPVADGATDIKKRLEQHRSNASCANCHSVIDPAGFALEHFNAIGSYRNVYEDGLPVDAAGILPTGQTIDGALDLAQQLKTNPATASCMVRHFLTFALGTEQTAQDSCAIDAMTQSAKARGFTFEGIIEAIIESPSFLQRTRLGGKAL